MHLLRLQATYTGPDTIGVRSGSTWTLTLAAERVEIGDDGRLCILLGGMWTNVHRWLGEYSIDRVDIEPLKKVQR